MTIYYISPIGTDGATHTGSASDPWKTLNYATTRVTIPGDVIRATAGIHYITTQVNMPLGVNLEGVGTSTVFVCTVTSTAIWTIAGFAIAFNSYPLANGNQYVYNLKMEGNNRVGYGAIGVWYRSNVSIHDCRFENFNYWGVRFYGGEPPADAAHYVTGSSFYNNYMNDCAGYYGGSQGCLGIGGVDGMEIYGNTIIQPGTRGVANEGEPIYGVEGFIKNVKIHENTLTKVYITTGTWDFAIEIWNYQGGNEIYNNDITGSVDIVNATKGTSTYSVWVHNNRIGQPYLYGTERPMGIAFEASTEKPNVQDAIIEHNHFKNVAIGIMGNFMRGSCIFQNIRISSNLFENIGVTGVNSKGWGMWWQPSDDGVLNNTVNNIQILNNTFIGYEGNSTMWGINVPAVGTVTNIVVRNNIVRGFDYAAVLTTTAGLSPVTIDHLDIDHNIFYQNGYSNVPRFIGITPTNYPAPVNTIADPGFVSSTNFHLASVSSVAYHTGVNVGLTTDMDGVNYATPNPSKGAYEFVAVGPPILVTSITLSSQGGATTIITPDGTLQMTASVLPANAVNKVVVWSIINGSGTASISITGLVTAITDGTVTARATATDGSGVYGSFVITISHQNDPILVTSITVTGTNGFNTITTKGGTLQLIATALPVNATNKNVTWSLTNGSGSASISGSGLVTAITDGTVTARATATDGSGVYGNFIITISNQITLVTSINVTGTGGATVISTNGGTLQMIATVLPAGANNKVVNWSVISGSGTANISGSGLLTALTNGTVTVRATATDGTNIYGSLVITISNQIILLTSITVTSVGGANTIVVPDGTLQMQVAYLPVTATNKTCTWSVIYGSGSASINSAGLLTAITDGTVTVRGTANDGTGVYGSFVVTISHQNDPVLVTSITVSGTGGSHVITTYHGTLQLSAVVLPIDASNKNYVWSVINGTGSATINSSGLVTGVSNGNVTARATALDGSGIYGDYPITLSNQIYIYVLSITVSSQGGITSVTLPAGTLQMYASVLPSNANNTGYIWSVINYSGSGAGSISAGGLFLGLDDGVVIVRATAVDGSGIYGDFLITIFNQQINILVTSVVVTGTGGATTISVNNGTLQMLATVGPANATDKTVIWSIINGTGTGSITSLGLVTALTDGNVTIRATANDGSGIYGNRVLTFSNQADPPDPIPVTSITVTGQGGATNLSVYQGTLQMYAAVLPVDADDPSVTWSVIPGTGSGQISAGGLLSGITNGLITVRATANDGSSVYGERVITLSNQTLPEVKKNLAPSGWHVALSADYWELVQTIEPGTVDGGDSTVGGKLKSMLLNHWSIPNVGATDDYGFHGIGAGTRQFNGQFIHLGAQGVFWNADDYDLTIARASWLLNNTVNFVTSGGVHPTTGAYKKCGYSVRCVKDDSNDPGSVDDIDLNTYITTKIGNQVWMDRNLEVEHFNDGTPIPIFTGNDEWAALESQGMCYYENITSVVSDAYCWYDNDSVNKEPYGALYNHYAVMNAHVLPFLARNGIQEVGWRVATKEDYEKLMLEYDPDGTALSNTAGNELKETGSSHWGNGNAGTNLSGFTAIGNGARDGTTGLFSAINNTAYLWNANIEYSQGVMSQLFGNQSYFLTSVGATIWTINRKFGAAVRLVRDVV